VTQELLREECAWPSASEGQKVKSAFRRAPSLAACSRLVDCVGQERQRTANDVDSGKPEGRSPEQADCGEQDQEDRNGEQRGDSPLGLRFATRLEARADGPHGCNVLCTLLALRPEFNLEREHLIDLRPASSGLERLDVDEDLLSALSGLDESEAAIVVPCLESSFKAHVKSRDEGLALGVRSGRRGNSCETGGMTG
jgi:hypothetical protein